MKKILLMFLTLALLLSLGTFAVKAVTQSAFEGNSFNFSGVNLDSYVQNKVYKWKYDNTTNCKCSNVELPTVNATGYYDSESDCLAACKKGTATSYTSGASGSFDLNFNSNLNTKTTPSSSAGSLYTGGSASGLNSFSFSDTSVKTQGGTTPSMLNTTNNLNSLNFNNTTINKTTGGLGTTNLFGTNLQYNTNSNLQLQGTATKPQTTFFGSLLEKFGLGKTDTITPQGGKTPTDDGTDKVEGDIAFSYSPSQVYGKGETIKIEIIKPTNIKSFDSFWYDLSVDWKNTPNDKSDDIVKEANEITSNKFEIKTDGYYRMEITIKGFKAGKTQSQDKWTTSKTVVLTYNEDKKAGTETIKNDCYLDITGFKPSVNNKIGFTADNPEAVTVDFKLNCTSFDAKYFDVRPISVSAYIDVPALHSIDKDSFACETKTIEGNAVYTPETYYTVTCSKEKVVEALKKESTEDTRNRFLMVDMYYMTNKQTNTHNGEEYKARFISTKDKISMPKPTDKPGDDKNPPTDGSKSMVLKTDIETFKDCNAGKVKITWSSTGYEKCKLSGSEKISYIESSDLKGELTKSIGKNSTSDVVNHFITLTCADKDKKSDEKKVQINVPKCDNTSDNSTNDTTGDGTSIKGKCDANKCTADFSLGSQVVLNMNDKKVLNASTLKFGVKLGGSTCNLNTFQKTFARIKIDGKIIQDITIPANTKEREYTFGNVWTQLSEQTRKNIENTLAKYDGAKIKVELESWSTFDETKGKTWNCNWSLISKEITFVKGTTDNKGDNTDNSTIDVATCKKTCKNNFDKLSETDMISTYKGNSKQEAYQNCIAKCEGKTIPFPNSPRETFEPDKSGGITSGTNVGMCATGYPKFVYGTLHTPDNSYGIAAVQIDYSGCCFKDLVRGYGVKYQNNPSSIKVTSLNSKGAVDTRAYFGTDSTGNVTYDSDTTICIGDAKMIGNSCERYCIYSNSNGKTTETCNFDTNYQDSCPVNYPAVEYGTLSNGGTCVKTDFSKCSIQGKGVTGSVYLSDSPVGALQAYNKDKTYCLLTLSKVYSKTNITAWFYNQPQLHCEYTNIDGKLTRSCFNIQTCRMENK